jgi:predicted nuclease of predicted toxin-antitoxin system
MQFKIDENLPIEIAELLINTGHDAKTVNNQQLQGAKDPALIDVCRNEHRVLVTLDTDFSECPQQADNRVLEINIQRLRPSQALEPLGETVALKYGKILR